MTIEWRTDELPEFVASNDIVEWSEMIIILTVDDIKKGWYKRYKKDIGSHKAGDTTWRFYDGGSNSTIVGWIPIEGLKAK